MNLLELKDKVQRWLMEAGMKGITLTAENTMSFRVGSTRVFVTTEERGSGDQVFHTVKIVVPFLQKVTPGAALYKKMAYASDDYLFGHFILISDGEEDASSIVALKHSLLGDYLDPEELKHAVLGMAYVSDDIDDEWAAEFQGEVFHHD